MWLIVMFDLPTLTAPERKHYRDFRAVLKRSGFFRVQLSIYARYMSSDERASTIASNVEAQLPAAGEIRLLRLTDGQFERLKCFQKGSPKPPENAPEQLTFL